MIFYKIEGKYTYFAFEAVSDSVRLTFFSLRERYNDQTNCYFCTKAAL